MKDQLELFKSLKDSSSKLICMIAPSFAADFDYPEIIYRIRKLGFDKVTELTFGAKMTNLTYYSILKENLDKTWITSPCPTLVNFIRTRYPHLVQNLVPVHSPMICMSLICSKFYPNHKQVFIGPCITTKNDAEETGKVSCVLTFKELESLFHEYSIPEIITEKKFRKSFEKFYNDYTKIYPLSGGLSATLHHRHLFEKKDILVMDGMSKIDKVLSKFRDGRYKNYKLIDILTCNKGCIGGLGMIENFSLDDRYKRIMKYRDYARKYEKNLGRTGTKVIVEDIDFRRKF
jgi:iron only hydrogenase large subunit-like protein